jgi:hypothetical protein
VCLHALHSIGNGTAIAVQAGTSHVCILRADNTTAATDTGVVLCWGKGDQGQLVRSKMFLHIYIHTCIHTYMQCVHVACVCLYPLIVTCMHISRHIRTYKHTHTATVPLCVVYP